jgi:hypothetical protein
MVPSRVQFRRILHSSKQFVGCGLEFFRRDLSAQVGLELRVELIEFLHAGFLSYA